MVFGNATVVLINFFMSKLLIIDFPYYDFARCLILSVIEDMLAQFFTLLLLVFLLKFSANLNTFIWICSHL